ncbi:MAG: reverse transcriptase domain-containing protein [Cyanobacteria bacterium P01_H01_bin.105]
MANETPIPYKSFEQNFRVRKLNSIYSEKFSHSKLKGVDRLNGYSFACRAKTELKTISHKSLNADYKFSPYLELLKSKGRGKEPRILAIPTIRDRIVLNALKEVLFEVFPECVKRDFSNSFVHKIKQTADLRNPQVGFFRTDIKNFYGSIDHSILLKKIKTKTRSKKILKMIKRSISRPIVPKIYRKDNLKSYRVSGVPQGLSISNILAEIYMHEVDEIMQKDSRVIHYCRYVDDILIIARRDHIADVVKTLTLNLPSSEDSSLELNEDKTHTNVVLADGFRVSKTFEYLGYLFDNGSVAPKKSSEEKIIRSVISEFCEYRHAFEKLIKSRKKHKRKKAEMDKLKKAIIFRLNERITGAISEKKKYGWIFYFSEINDLSSLHRIDSVIRRIFNSRSEFGNKAPANLKKVSRAYYEAKYTPRSGYIHDYSNYRTVEQKRDFLIGSGFDTEARLKGLKPNSVIKKFDLLMRRNLSKLVEDETFIY